MVLVLVQLVILDQCVIQDSGQIGDLTAFTSTKRR